MKRIECYYSKKINICAFFAVLVCQLGACTNAQCVSHNVKQDKFYVTRCQVAIDTFEDVLLDIKAKSDKYITPMVHTLYESHRDLYEMQTYNATVYTCVAYSGAIEEHFLKSLECYLRSYVVLMFNFRNKHINKETFIKQYIQIKNEMIEATKRILHSYNTLVRDMSLNKLSLPLLVKAIQVADIDTVPASYRAVKNTYYTYFMKKKEGEAQSLIENNAHKLKEIHAIYSFADLLAMVRNDCKECLAKTEYYFDGYKEQQALISDSLLPCKTAGENAEYAIHLTIYEQTRSCISLENIQKMYFKALNLMEKKTKTLGLTMPKRMP